MLTVSELPASSNVLPARPVHCYCQLRGRPHQPVVQPAGQRPAGGHDERQRPGSAVGQGAGSQGRQRAAAVAKKLFKLNFRQET